MSYEIFGPNSTYRSASGSLPEIRVFGSSHRRNGQTHHSKSLSLPRNDQRRSRVTYEITEEEEDSPTQRNIVPERKIIREAYSERPSRRGSAIDSVEYGFYHTDYISRRTSLPILPRRYGRFSFQPLDYHKETPYYLRRPRSVEMENARFLLRTLMESRQSSRSQLSKENSDISETNRSADSIIRLEEHIKLHHLQKLLRQFQTHKPLHLEYADDTQEERKAVPLQKGKDSITGLVPQGAGMMTLEEFKAIISAMLGTTKWNDQMEMLFYKVDTGCDGYVDWNEFCTYMLLQMRELERIQNMKLIPFTTEAIVKRAYHNKQETTTKMLLVENPNRIVNISKVGDIGVWDTQLRLLKTYKLSSNSVPCQNGTKRRCHTWVTDAVYMRNAQKFALTTTSREIYFYDTSTTTYYAEFCLYALPDVPNCLNYWYNPSAGNSHSMILYGDDTGSVHILHFRSPQSRLFEKPFSPQQGTQRVYFNDIRDHKRYVSHECIPNIHQEVIRRVLYVFDGDVIISSSVSSSTSVVLMDIKKKKKPYVYKVNKGVECFDYSKPLNILVTGSLDHLVRLWNPYVVSKPICLLQGHSTGICDVVINRSFEQVISYSKDAVIKVWDIKEHNCLQSIALKIPTLQPGRIPDHGEFPLNLSESPHDLMLVSCNDCIALLKMGKVEPPPEAPTTHKAPLCGAIYNLMFHQVVTAADDSTVTVWDLESGSRSLKFSNAHGKEEITCLAFDKTCRRLITGARDGTIKVWNFQNGNCLHDLESVSEAEVTGLMSFQDRKILATGWSRLITLYDDSDPDTVNVNASTNWKGGQLHQDDILTMDHCDPSYLATGSYDGTIIVWNEETQHITTTLRDARELRNEKTECRSPVEKLMFLRHRISRRQKNGAVLLSSESGTIYWWSIFGHTKLAGRFVAVERKDASVLSMSTTHDDSILFTGDTNGNISVWDITNYCMEEALQAANLKPPLKHQWKGHDRAVVNIEYIAHDFLPSGLLVSASSDKTARLWTIDGKFIGTFGQQKKWDLKRPLTFQHPKDPWGNLVEVIPTEHAVNESLSSDELSDAESNEVISESHLEVIDESEEEDDQEIEIPLSDLNDDVDISEVLETERTHVTIDKNSNSNFDHKSDVNRLSQRRMTSHPNADGKPRDIGKARLQWKESRSTTISQFQVAKEEKILGEKAERHLARRTVARQERRYRVGYINRNTTSRFAGLCSPFQALSIPDTKSIDFSAPLPMSKRMQDKGMACMSEDDLVKLPLSNLFEFGDNENNFEPTSKSQRTHSSRRKFHHGTTRRNNLLPPLSSRASSAASLRTLGGSRPASSIGESR